MRTFHNIIASLATASLLAAGCSSPASNDHRGDVTYTTSLVQFNNCEALEADLEALLIEEVETSFDQIGYWGGPILEDGAGQPAPNQSDDTRTEGEDYSGTNNQEEGVDESDFVKTDGYHVYVLNGNRLHIFGTPEFGDLIPESEFELEGWPREMLVNAETNKAVVFSDIWVWDLPEEHPLRALLGFDENGTWMWRVGSVSKLTIIDITDRTAPVLERELFIEGSHQTARMVDASVRVGTYSWMYIPGLYDWWWYYYENENDVEEARRQAIERIRALSLSDIVPNIYERLPSGEIREHGLARDACQSFYRPENSHGRGFTSIMSLDLRSNGLQFDSDHVLSNYPIIYSSLDNMYIAEPAHDWWWFWWNTDHPDQTNIHKFDIHTPGRSVYQGSGRVAGMPINQFALSEQDGYLRVATTTDRWARWWSENPADPDNHVFVLDEQGGTLVEVGHVNQIAPGETIFAVRMIGAKGFVVTFEQIDPLFTLDLSDPTNPRVIGELEIPGFSTYIHPLAEDKLLTIGVGGDENGANWLTQVSMFDVSDFANPSVFDQHQLITSGEWGWSEALYEHKAFQYWAPKELLAVPLSGYREVGVSGYWEYLSTLELVTVDLVTGLDSYGSIDHSSLYNSDPENYWYYRDIRRSIFMGDYIYAISDAGVTVHDLNDLSTPVNQQPLPGYAPYDWYWWW